MRRYFALTLLEKLAILIAPALAALPSSVHSNETASLKRSSYTYVDEASRSWCGTVGYVDANGPGGVSFAWFVFDAEPRRLVHVPMAELLSGCARPIAERPTLQAMSKRSRFITLTHAATKSSASFEPPSALP